MSDDHKKIDAHSGTETTGHEWDGIEELNTPMPRWWLWIFYATIIWAIGYMVLYPSVPLLKSHFKGVLGHSDRAAVASAIEDLNAQRYSMETRLTGASLEGIQADPDLFRFAMASGKSAFGDNCATCHGSGGQGFKGYPNLNDDIWLWGGTFDAIRHTLQVGIRAEHPETQANYMLAYGRDGMLSKSEISDLTDYVLSLSGAEHDREAASRAAPNLTDNDWLYGGSREDITQTLYFGRAGVMPHWSERLSPETITALAVYVHSLGGGVASDASSGGAMEEGDPTP